MMFTEHEIRMTPVHVLAITFWCAAIVVWAVSWATDTIYLAGLAIILSAAAGTTSVRAFFATHREEMKTALMVTGRSGSVYTLR